MLEPRLSTLTPRPTSPVVGGAAAGPAGAASRETSGSHSSLAGKYQFQSPSSFIDAGNRTARIMVASIRTAAASPTPIILKSSALSVAKIANTNTITTAALVTVPAVLLIPCATASSVLIPLST